MRRVSRGALVVSLVLALSAPAYARPSKDEPPSRNPIVKIIKKMLKTFGDGLVIPIP